MASHNKRGMQKILLVFMLLPGSSALAAPALGGSWQCRSAEGAHTLVFKDSSTLLFDGEASAYSIMGDTLLVQDEGGVSPYYYQLQGNTLAVQFPDGSRLHCTRDTGTKKAPPAQKAAPGANNTTLARQIAGTWWGYAGSTERKLGLCPDGSYRDYTESSYSGHSYDSGGNETMNWGAAGARGNSGRWTIQGDTQSGTINVQTNNGKQFQLRYHQVGKPGCLDFNGARLCRTSARCD